MKRIKLSAAWFSEQEADAVARVMKTGSVSMGRETQQFESELLSFLGKPDAHVICVHSCTAALLLATQACGIGAGDEVLIPTLTFVATFQAVKACGAVPVPCDVTDDGFIDLSDAAESLTSRTKAIMPVLYAGCDSRIYDVYQFAEANNLRVIEDAAHCFGDENIANRDGIMCFSFDPIKNISCGDGGCILTSDSAIAKKLADMRLLGVIGDTERRYSGQRSWDFDVTEQGWRLHMNDIAAAIGRTQLARFPQIRERRRRSAKMYMKALSAISELQLFPINTETAVPHIFPIIVKDGSRDGLQAFLAEAGIETGVQYKPTHLLSYFDMGYDLPNAVRLYESMLSLPLHPLLSDNDGQYVIDTIFRFFRK
ncbi:MAG: DegT/DnrJ/EryC1/StrS family aminotransferase [Holosporales bacterium]|nr:DegT/DnrJ/EryC1/StrS family aminotransferase [Holosporales bacterium]